MDDFQIEEKAFVVDEVNNVIKEVYQKLILGYWYNYTKRSLSSKQGWTMEFEYCRTDAKETHGVKQTF